MGSLTKTYQFSSECFLLWPKLVHRPLPSNFTEIQTFALKRPSVWSHNAVSRFIIILSCLLCYQRRIQTFSKGAKLHVYNWDFANLSGVRGTMSTWSWHLLISQTNFLTKLSHKFGISGQHDERGSTLAPANDGQGVSGKLRTFSYFRD